MSPVMRVSRCRVPNLNAFGDSLTAGTGATGELTKFPTVVANSFTRARAYVNAGVGGETSTQIATRLLAQSNDEKRATTIIWAGRNNYSDAATVKSDIASMVATLPHQRYLILSIINGDNASEYVGQSGWNSITTLNTDLAALYGERFVDVRRPLVAVGAPGGSSPDATNYARDVPPAGIRLDAIHLLDAGYAIVASAVAAKIVALGF